MPLRQELQKQLLTFPVLLIFAVLASSSLLKITLLGRNLLALCGRRREHKETSTTDVRC